MIGEVEVGEGGGLADRAVNGKAETPGQGGRRVEEDWRRIRAGIPG
jgi:hypothetical protein